MLRKIFLSKSADETKRAAKFFLRLLPKYKKNPLVIALEGNLGAGKTTLTQGLAALLGIKEKVASPTFVLLKIYSLSPRVAKTMGKRRLVHVDCYRVGAPKEMLRIGLKKFLVDRDAIVLVEWADRIKKILPKEAVWARFLHGRRQAERKITITWPLNLAL